MEQCAECKHYFTTSAKDKKTRLPKEEWAVHEMKSDNSRAVFESEEKAAVIAFILTFLVLCLPMLLLTTSCWMLYSRQRRRKQRSLKENEDEEISSLLLRDSLSRQKLANDVAYRDLAMQLESMRGFQTQVRQQLQTLRSSAEVMKQRDVDKATHDKSGGIKRKSE